MLRVKNNRPFYSPFWSEYIVEWSLNGEKFSRPVGTYQDGLKFLKDSFPEWFSKHYAVPAGWGEFDTTTD